MVPVISFVGQSNSGKTTYLVKLIAAMKRRGYKVGTIKHHKGDFEIDIPGKDTWRHAQAGADVVCIAAPGKMAMIHKLEAELSVAELVRQMAAVDVVFTEGYKDEGYPKVEVFRSAADNEPVAGKAELLAVVGDVKLYDDVPLFELNDPDSLAGFIETWLSVIRK
jgi:molybdopterin-guanine dinucleotide biosynthesis protein B